MSELKNRGVEDILIAVVDGLKGFPDAITAVFPQAQVQTCIVHLIRNSLAFVPYKDHKAVADALKEIYRAKDADAGAAALEAFAAGDWGRKYPAIAMSWRRRGGAGGSADGSSARGAPAGGHPGGRRGRLLEADGHRRAGDACAPRGTAGN